MRADLPLMKNVFTPLVKIFLLLLWVKAAVWATDAAIQNRIYWLGMTKLIFSNEELNGIIKIIKSLEDAGLLIKGVSETA